MYTFVKMPWLKKKGGAHREITDVTMWLSRSLGCAGGSISLSVVIAYKN